MAKSKKRVAGKKRSSLQTALFVFEESCQILRENWRCCLEIYLLLVAALIFSGVILFCAWQIDMPWWAIFILCLSLGELLTMGLIGKNKNLNSLLRDLVTGRYPLWAASYLNPAWLFLVSGFLLNFPLLLAIFGVIFFWFVSPSPIWLVLSAIGFGGIWLWLFIRFGFATSILSLKNQHLSLVESWRQSWRLTNGQEKLLLTILVLNLIFFLPAFIFLPVLSWFLIAPLASLQKLLIRQLLIDKKVV
ncbi:MAG: hypothetical protein Q4G02_01515 [bacterium]|nr:hypothetical protein [bacterium]